MADIHIDDIPEKEKALTEPEMRDVEGGLLVPATKVVPQGIQVGIQDKPKLNHPDFDW